MPLEVSLFPSPCLSASASAAVGADSDDLPAAAELSALLLLSPPFLRDGLEKEEEEILVEERPLEVRISVEGDVNAADVEEGEEGVAKEGSCRRGEDEVAGLSSCL